MPITKRVAFVTLAALAACQSVDVSASSSNTVTATTTTDLGSQPMLGPVVSAAKPPPAISGGTLSASKISPVAVASDPDRDRIYVVDLDAGRVRSSIQLPAGSEPGRVELDEQGLAYVVLRGTNQLATVTLATGAIAYRATCTAPRGVAYDKWRERVLVTCATGDLMSFPRTGASNGYWARVGNDLRDVLVREDGIRLTSFRKAQLYSLDSNGIVGAPPALRSDSVVAWRARQAPTLDPKSSVTQQELVVAQEAADVTVSTGPDGYSNSGTTTNCDSDIGIVSTRLWMLSEDCTGQGYTCFDSVRLPQAVLPVDVASNGDTIVVVAAGNAFSPALPQLFAVSAWSVFDGNVQDCVATTTGTVTGQAVAVDFSAKNQLLVQTREPAELHIMAPADLQNPLSVISLAPESVADTGHEIFHANAGGSVACASCHAEGGDDSHVWTFDDTGPRRTPSLRGTLAGTAPYHWDGSQKNMTDIVDHVFVGRMSGPSLSAAQVNALQSYLFALPPPPAMRAPTEVPQSGKDLFAQQCASCHSGAKLTNNQTVDVGSGGAFQVPSLVGVAWRAPWFHDGAAPTLQAHATAFALTPEQSSDIIAYLESL